MVTTWTDDDSRRLTVMLVAHDGHNLPLRGADRAEAIRAMVARGVDTETIATRLCIDLGALQRFAYRYRITLPPVKPPQPWWVAVVEPSATARARRRQKQAQRARAAISRTGVSR